MSLQNFSDADMSALRDMMNWFRSNIAGGGGGGFNNTPSYRPGEVDLSPETYLIKPLAIIPKLISADEGTGTGPEGIGDRPGSGDADIYRIVEDWPSTPHMELIETKRRVYNLSPGDLQTSWAVATRTKFGFYVVIAGSTVCP